MSENEIIVQRLVNGQTGDEYWQLHLVTKKLCYQNAKALKGDPYGQFRLASELLSQKMVPTEPERALELLEQAALQGYQPAHDKLNQLLT